MPTLTSAILFSEAVVFVQQDHDRPAPQYPAFIAACLRGSEDSVSRAAARVAAHGTVPPWNISGLSPWIACLQPTCLLMFQAIGVCDGPQDHHTQGTPSKRGPDFQQHPSALSPGPGPLGEPAV
ncbi:hypothetical protein NDU88_006923 [Pleurodeles waltl]|uniref:Uncharacterized protein n=1 Tax=Pleurodeles waltl TaxID=8319 RepID=A0AAV7LRU5_PLEWA|nr:hypothetical protein NDU88_006923 [Pleurodeles waltl]